LASVPLGNGSTVIPALGLLAAGQLSVRTSTACMDRRVYGLRESDRSKRLACLGVKKKVLVTHANRCMNLRSGEVSEGVIEAINHPRCSRPLSRTTHTPLTTSGGPQARNNRNQYRGRQRTPIGSSPLGFGRHGHISHPSRSGRISRGNGPLQGRMSQRHFSDSSAQALTSQGSPGLNHILEPSHCGHYGPGIREYLHRQELHGLGQSTGTASYRTGGERSRRHGTSGSEHIICPPMRTAESPGRRFHTFDSRNNVTQGAVGCGRHGPADTATQLSSTEQPHSRRMLAVNHVQTAANQEEVVKYRKRVASRMLASKNVRACDRTDSREDGKVKRNKTGNLSKTSAVSPRSRCPSHRLHQHHQDEEQYSKLQGRVRNHDSPLHLAEHCEIVRGHFTQHRDSQDDKSLLESSSHTSCFAGWRHRELGKPVHELTEPSRNVTSVSSTVKSPCRLRHKCNQGTDSRVAIPVETHSSASIYAEDQTCTNKHLTSRPRKPIDGCVEQLATRHVVGRARSDTDLCWMERALCVAHAALEAAGHARQGAERTAQRAVSAQNAAEAASRALAALERDMTTSQELMTLSGSDCPSGLQDVDCKILSVRTQLDDLRLWIDTKRYCRYHSEVASVPRSVDMVASAGTLITTELLWVAFAKANRLRAVAASQWMSVLPTDPRSILETATPRVSRSMNILNAAKDSHEGVAVWLKEALLTRRNDVCAAWDGAVRDYRSLALLKRAHECICSGAKSDLGLETNKNNAGCVSKGGREAQDQHRRYPSAQPFGMVSTCDGMSRSLRNHTRGTELIDFEETIVSAVLVSSAREARLEESVVAQLPACAPPAFRPQNPRMSASTLARGNDSSPTQNAQSIDREMCRKYADRDYMHGPTDHDGCVRPLWTDVEKIIFLDKFVQYPKNFSRIAMFLSRKRPRDCVAFYYDTKYEIDYKALLREHQQRRRGKSGSWDVTQRAVRAFGGDLTFDLERNMVWFRLPVTDHVACTTPWQPSVHRIRVSQRIAYRVQFLEGSLGHARRFPDVCGRRSPKLHHCQQATICKIRSETEFDVQRPKKRAESPGLSGSPTVLNKKRTSRTSPRHEAKLPGDNEDEPRGAMSPVGGHDSYAAPQVTSEVAMRRTDEVMHCPGQPRNCVLQGRSGDLLSADILMCTNTKCVEDADVAPCPSCPSRVPSDHNATTTMFRRSMQKWSNDEKELFLRHFSSHGKNWAILTRLIPSKSEAQIKNYYQNYKNRLGLQQILASQQKTSTYTPTCASEAVPKPAKEDDIVSHAWSKSDSCSLDQHQASTMRTCSASIEDHGARSTETSAHDVLMRSTGSSQPHCTMGTTRTHCAGDDAVVAISPLKKSRSVVCGQSTELMTTASLCLHARLDRALQTPASTMLGSADLGMSDIVAPD